MKRYFSATLILSLIIAFATPVADSLAYSRHKSSYDRETLQSLTSQTLSAAVTISPAQEPATASVSGPVADSSQAESSDPAPGEVPATADRELSVPATVLTPEAIDAPASEADEVPAVSPAEENPATVADVPAVISAPVPAEPVGSDVPETQVESASAASGTQSQQSAVSSRINPVGISTHLNELSYAEIDRQLDLAQAAGAYWIRFDFSWDQMQEDDGSWDFSKYDYIVNGINARGMQTLALLTQYEIEQTARSGRGSLTPMTAGEFGSFASRVSAHFKGRIGLYELGNEPNNEIYWNTGVDARAYVALMIAGDDAIKAQDGGAKTISAGIPPLGNMESFLQAMYDAGAKGHFDYLGYHPYSTHSSPDKDFGDMWLAREIELKNGDDKPVIATEIGWSTATGGVTEAQQAEYTGRVYQKIMAEDYQYVLIACTYDFRNDGPSISDWESNFGMLRYDYSKKPVYTAMQAQRAYYESHFG